MDLDYMECQDQNMKKTTMKKIEEVIIKKDINFYRVYFFIF